VKTAVEPVPEWTAIDERADGSCRLVRAGADLTIDVRPLVPIGDREAQARAAVLGDTSPSAARFRERAQARTTLGWPMEVFLVDVDGAQPEARLAFVLELIDHVAVLVVRARPPALLDGHRDEIRAIVGSARPDWSTDELVALAEAWR
jgi:hypothetical protein